MARDCLEVSPLCPVQATVLGYYPNLGSGIFFAIVFGILTVASLVLGIWKKTYTYAIGLSIGLLLEMLGYIGRIQLNSNPWNEGAFELQICAIILAPTFICVSIYLTLKHIAINLNPSVSRIPPRWYPIIFLPADLSCLIVQAIGGGIAAAGGKTNRKLQESGNRAIIAGVALQVVVLIAFGVLSVDYYVRVRKYMARPEAQGTQGWQLWHDAKFKKFRYAISGAFIVILIRCIYRIAEMAGGWGNRIMQDQASFLVLDSTLIFIASFLLTFFHPGIYFPAMRRDRIKARLAAEAASGAEGPAEEIKMQAAGSSSEGIKTHA
ncbi:RTA1-domain-containing protein [Trichoderma citrinoviride]|uniref:RTA1-domain-containing protein n=1 Tax=Trichoderma citrinoviride TaxID=58853 RepID=A0A2T4BBQ3_9HYPO|nr:RTA1-domain-containing protein [Trichoderma citrinoviride]PTB66718.1 RTA1-domain-containing protein [Trichoderma citrinoviride]